MSDYTDDPIIFGGLPLGRILETSDKPANYVGLSGQCGPPRTMP